MAVYTILGINPRGDQPLRYDVVAPDVETAMQTIRDHVAINGGRNLQLNFNNDGTSAQVKGRFRTADGEILEITIYDQSGGPIGVGE